MIRDRQGNFTADPQCVATHYVQEWKRERSSEDTIGFNKEMSSIRALCEMHVEEAREWAGNRGLRAENFREACLFFPAEDGDRPRLARIQ